MILPNDLIKAYLEFQKRFKSIQKFSCFDLLLIEALDVLKELLLETDVKLIYPSFFVPNKHLSEFNSIGDDIMIIDHSTSKMDLEAYIALHLIYYAKGFPRISQKLVNNEFKDCSGFWLLKSKQDKEKYCIKIFSENEFVSQFTIKDDKIFNIEDLDISGVSKKYNFISAKETDNKENLSEESSEGYRVGRFNIKLTDFEKKTYANTYFKTNKEVDHYLDLSANDKNQFINVFEESIFAHLLMVEKSTLLYIFSKTAKISSSKDTTKPNDIGYGGLFVLLREQDYAKETENEYITRIEEYRLFFQLVSDVISTSISHNIMQQKVNTEAEKSAKAAIMARNMSHNLGSHVMAYLRHRLATVQDIIKGNSLDNIISSSGICNDISGIHAAIKEKTDISKDIELPFLVGLGRFINYLQERQEFIATISTDYIPYTSPVNFKDEIYDILTPDLRHISHADRSGAKPENILLSYIAASENLKRDIDGKAISNVDDYLNAKNIIKLYFRDFIGVVPKKRNLAGIKEDEIKKIKESLDVMKGIDVALPGGGIGRQAVFSILENIMRNAAKHGRRDANRSNLELTFDILDLNNEKHKQRIENISTVGIGTELDHLIKTDDKEDKTESYDQEDVTNLKLSLWDLLLADNSHYQKHNASDSDDLYVFTITDNLLTDAESLMKLVVAMRTPYVDDFGRMDNTAKGLKEIRISAAWLRGLDDADEADIKTKAPIVTIRGVKDASGEGYNLQYIVCLQKPRNVAIISDNESLIKLFNEHPNNELAIRNGWRIFSKLQWIDSKINKSFETILVDQADGGYIKVNGVDRVINTEIKLCSPDRLLWATSEEISDIVNASLTDKKSVKCGYEYIWYRLLLSKGRLPEETKIITLKDSKFIYREHGDLTDENIQLDTAINIEDAKCLPLYFDENPNDELQISLKNTKGYVKVYADAGVCNNSKYLFRTHHGSTTDTSMGNYLESTNEGEVCHNTIYVEAITGHNSTDRLIRNKNIDLIWYFKQKNVVDTKIAICDERIFKKICGLDDSQIIDDLAAQKEMLSTDTFATLQLQKGTTVMNIIEVEHRKDGYSKFCLVGTYRDRNMDTLGIVQSQIIKMSEIEIFSHNAEDCDKPFNITRVDGNENYNFDYFSIHQGLLDKVYNHLKYFSEENSKEIKEKITNELQQKFVTDKENNGFVIHSGRSKPSEKDMPQRIPFIQFAAIETAVFDSKSTLVEILNFARYE